MPGLASAATSYSQPPEVPSPRTVPTSAIQVSRVLTQAQARFRTRSTSAQRVRLLKHCRWRARLQLRQSEQCDQIWRNFANLAQC